MKKPYHKLRIADFLGYGIGQTGNQVLRDVPATLLLFYMTNALLIPAAYAGLAILLPKIWVVIADPMVGNLSDNIRGRWGGRKPFMVAGALLSSASFLLLFGSPVPHASVIGALVIGLLYTLLCTGMSLYSVPYLATAVDLSDDPRERTTAIAFKHFFALIGVICGLALAPVLISRFGGGSTAYTVMGLVLGSTILVTTLLTALIIPVHQSASEVGTVGSNIFVRFVDAFRHRPFRIVFIASTLQLLAFGITGGASIYYVVYVVHLALNYYSMFVLASVLGAALSQPFWVKTSSRFGTLTAYRIAVLYALILSTAYLILPDRSPRLFIALGFVSGAGTMGYTLMSFAMLVEAIALDGPDSSRKGLFAAAYTAMEKVMLALGGFLIALMLSVSHFVEGAGAASQPSSVPPAILFTLVGAPFTSLLLSLFVLAHYNKQPDRFAWPEDSDERVSPVR